MFSREIAHLRILDINKQTMTINCLETREIVKFKLESLNAKFLFFILVDKECCNSIV